MIARRAFLASGAVLALASSAGAIPKLAEDGLYHFDWFLESFSRV